MTALCRESHLLEEIERLKGEVSYWRGEAQLQTDDAVRDRLARSFGLTGAEAWIVAALHGRQGEVVKRHRLNDELPSPRCLDGERFGNTIEVMISRIRAKFGAANIITVRGIGYRLSATGVARCDNAIAELRGVGNVETAEDTRRAA